MLSVLHSSELSLLSIGHFHQCIVNINPALHSTMAGALAPPHGPYLGFAIELNERALRNGLRVLVKHSAE